MHLDHSLPWREAKAVSEAGRDLGVGTEAEATEERFLLAG